MSLPTWQNTTNSEMQALSTESLPSSFIICLFTSDEDLLSKALVSLFLVFCHIGEFFSLDRVHFPRSVLFWKKGFQGRSKELTGQERSLSLVRERALTTVCARACTRKDMHNRFMHQKAKCHLVASYHSLPIWLLLLVIVPLHHILKAESKNVTKIH